ncbi:enolase C-terminal domain-like protein [Sulfurirhabdus autotrophica]|uniref:L-alanine-DL-glutamate epimerase-like enolase superfamily enzyme n=1 Tax=Sulfurirhabdus autotrophica TaxID=1706046 RepID=A0A4V2W1X8_9PROT|nr:enolase C-terminal domain-like protein [Sulfurirhabdus autotrophica]TCV85919.1 L-alanine-DL-glutamate epimerase-like enolase superfamily enzyme [Sulfurirhabdus autotrophica]
MKMIGIELKALEIPFRVTFKHAAAERSATEAVVTIAKSERGLMGYGEGCPRSYVTQESVDSAKSFFEEIKSTIIQIENLASLKIWVMSHQQMINDNPAAWCSIETAILDLLGKEENKTIDALLELPDLQNEFLYTAVLGVTNHKAFLYQLKQYTQLGFNDFKVKLCGAYDLDKKNIDELAKLSNIKVRVDANNLWQNANEAVGYIQSLGYPFWAIEEPLSVGDYDGLENIANWLNAHIILDESFLKIEQIETLCTYSIPWILNIRISKMGGIIRSLEIVREAKSRNLKYVIGAQVGETSILTRLALSLANMDQTSLLAQEGAFGTYLLERDVTEKPIVFGKKGKVTAELIEGDGLGVNCIL